MKKLNIAGMTKRQLIKKSGTTVVLSMAIAAIIVSFSLVVVNFLWDLNQHNNRVISEKSKASSILKQNVNNISALQASFNVFEAGDVKSATILDALPSKYDYPALATSMESLVQRSGLTLEAFTGDDLEEGAVQSEVQPVPIEIEFILTVSGSYENVQKLITNLERTIRPMKITSLELKGNDGSMTTTIEVVTYYQPATSLTVETRIIE